MTNLISNKDNIVFDFFAGQHNWNVWFFLKEVLLVYFLKCVQVPVYTEKLEHQMRGFWVEAATLACTAK